MSVLSKLEKELGLSNSDLSSFRESDLCIYEGVDFSTPSASSPASDILVEETESIIQANKPKDKVAYWTPDVSFGAEEVANRMGIPIVNIANLYTHVLDLYKNTDRNDVKATCYKILVGLYYNNISREECNDLINKLNRMVR
jgi:hypothetical protein